MSKETIYGALFLRNAETGRYMWFEFEGQDPKAGWEEFKTYRAKSTGGVEYGVDWEWDDDGTPEHIYIHTQLPKGKSSHLYFQGEEGLKHYIQYMEIRYEKEQ